jgi:hypothetical protein
MGTKWVQSLLSSSATEARAKTVLKRQISHRRHKRHLPTRETRRFGGSLYVSPSLRNPFGCLPIADEIQQPAQESDAVLSPPSKPRGVRRECVRKRTGVVVNAPNCIGDNLSNRLGVFPIGEQVGRNASWPGDEQAAEGGPFGIRDLAVMEAHVRSTRLSSRRQGELVAVGRQVSEAVHGRGRPVGDHTLGGSSLPGKDIGRELEPGRAELEVVRRRRTRQVVHTLRDPLQHRFGSQPLEGGRRDSRSLGLTARHEPPLILCDVCEPVSGRVASHYCILARN